MGEATPAEQRAAREGMPVVLMLPFEALQVAFGHPIVLRAADGRQVLVRIPTADEFMAINAAAVQSLPLPEGWGSRPEPVSRKRAEALVRPIGGER